MCLHMSKNSSYFVLSLITHFWRKTTKTFSSKTKENSKTKTRIFKHKIALKMLNIKLFPFLFYLCRDLRFNHLKEVPSNAFKDMKQLHSIFLNENQITTIQSEAFSNLPALRYLYLHQNHIRNIAANAFVNLVRLERL